MYDMDDALKRMALGSMSEPEQFMFVGMCLRQEFPFKDWEPDLAASCKTYLKAKLAFLSRK